MTLPMIVLPRPAPSPARATPSAQGSSHDAGPGAAGGPADFAEMLGAAVLSGRSDAAAPQPTPPSSSPASPATPAADAPADPLADETLALTAQVEHIDPDEAERADPAAAGSDRSAAPLPTPAEAVHEIAPAVAATAAAGHRAATATDGTLDDPTADATGEHFGDDDRALAGPLAVRPNAGPSVQPPSPVAPEVGQDGAVDNTEPWAFAVVDGAAGRSDRPTGPTLTLPEVTPAPSGSAVGATLDSFPAPTSAAAPGSVTDGVDATAVADAIDLTDTALRELQRGELQRIGSSRLGIDVATTALGNIRIEALERGGELQLRLGAEHAGARVLLTERLPELREHLRAEGVDIGSIDVSSGHDRTRGDRERRAAPSNLASAETDPPSGDPASGAAVRALAPSVMTAAGRVDVRI